MDSSESSPIVSPAADTGGVDEITDAVMVIESPTNSAVNVDSQSISNNLAVVPPVTVSPTASPVASPVVSPMASPTSASESRGSDSSVVFVKDVSRGSAQNKYATLSGPLPPSGKTGVPAGRTRTSTVTDGRERAFATHLRHDFRGIIRHCREEVQEMKAAHALLKSYCIAELEHNRSMAKLLEGKTEVTKGSGNNEAFQPCKPQALEEPTNSLGDAWNKGRSAILSATHARVKSAKDLIEMLLNPLEEWIKTAETTLKAIATRQVKAKANVDAAKDTVTKNLNQCRRLIQQTKDAKENKEHKEKEEPSSTSSWLMSKVSSRISEIAGTTYDDLQKKLVQAVTAYKESIDHANTLQHRFYGEETTYLLRELQQFESDRINVWTQSLLKYARLEKQNNTPVLTLFNNYLENIALFDASQELPTWIDWEAEREPPPSADNDPALTGFETYQLDVSIGSIMSGKYDRNSKSPFFVTVEECVLQQVNDFSYELQCPAVVIYLAQGVRVSGGLKTEGIFRLTDEKDALHSLEQQLEQGNYSVYPNISPHAYAVTLKRWFKQLPDAMFTSHSVVVQYIRELMEVIDKRKTQNDDTPITLLPSFLSLPRLRCLAHLVTLLREVALSVNSSANRMTLQSLATMFAPCMFGSGSRDANNAKSEASALQMLFEYFPVDAASVTKDMQHYEEGRIMQQHQQQQQQPPPEPAKSLGEARPSNERGPAPPPSASATSAAPANANAAVIAPEHTHEPRVYDVAAVLRALASPEGLEYVAKVCDAPFRATLHAPSVEQLDALFQQQPRPAFSAIPPPLKDQLPNLLKRYVADTNYRFGTEEELDLAMARVCAAVISTGTNYKTFSAMRIAFPAITPIEPLFNQIMQEAAANSDTY